MAQFNITGNNFYEGSSFIRHYNEYNFNWSELEREVDILRTKTAGDATLSPAVSELQAAISNKKEHSVVQAIQQYASAFSSATFANLASAGILSLVKNFLF